MSNGRQLFPYIEYVEVNLRFPEINKYEEGVIMIMIYNIIVGKEYQYKWDHLSYRKISKMGSQGLEKLSQMWIQVHCSTIWSKSPQLGREKYNLQFKQSRK